MKRDHEGEYIEEVLRGAKTTPGSPPEVSFRKLYFLSPNSRYYIFVGFFCIAIIGLLVFFGMQGGPYVDSIPIVIIVVAVLAGIAFALPFVEAQRLKRALQCGVPTVGKVDDVRDGRTTLYSTAEGMRNGAIEALVLYVVDGLPCKEKVFLDRPWVSHVQPGSKLKLLVDPDKRSVLYVLGIAEHGRE